MTVGFMEKPVFYKVIVKTTQLGPVTPHITKNMTLNATHHFLTGTRTVGKIGRFIPFQDFDIVYIPGANIYIPVRVLRDSTYRRMLQEM